MEDLTKPITETRTYLTSEFLPVEEDDPRAKYVRVATYDEDGNEKHSRLMSLKLK